MDAFTQRARAVGVVGDGWPYGLSHRGADPAGRLRMVEWAESRGLKLSKGNCVHWLERGRCRNYADCYGGRWRDHSTGWTIDGKPALLLCQPYQIYDEDFAELAQLISQGYEVRVDTDGWYGCGSLTIEIWIPSQRRKSWEIREKRAS